MILNTRNDLNLIALVKFVISLIFEKLAHFDCFFIQMIFNYKPFLELLNHVFILQFSNTK